MKESFYETEREKLGERQKGKKDNTIMRKNLTKKQGKYLCVIEKNNERAK